MGDVPVAEMVASETPEGVCVCVCDNRGLLHVLLGGGARVCFDKD